MDMDQVIASVEDYWNSMETLSTQQLAKLRVAFRAQLLQDRAQVEKQATRNNRRIAELEAERRKLLQLYYRDKIQIELYEEEQTRINQELRRANTAVEDAAQQLDQLIATQDHVFELLERPGAIYHLAAGPIRRRLNRTMFQSGFEFGSAGGGKRTLTPPRPAVLAPRGTFRLTHRG